MPRILTMSALIVVDVQNDFTQGSVSLGDAPSGADAEATIASINSLLAAQPFDCVVYTLDYHPENHCSFKEWPVHCVAGTWGAQLDSRLSTKPAKCTDVFEIKKATELNVDSYSAFIDNDGKVETGLRAELQDRSINTIYVCGIALDYCVYSTALDAAKFGFKTSILLDCSASIQKLTDPDCQEKLEKLKKAGVSLIDSSIL